ncbi:MAG: hypothetical protein B7733_22720 [Myxococcales bacterium FL481]|nr:MAG: hypothetical protein B7733_22720 [Myxococcales bacterium FL481]
MLEARRAALRAAISDLALERSAVAEQVLARPQPWTAAYRVLEQRVEAGQVLVRLEVDIDLPRLAKRLHPPPPGSQPAYRLGRIDGLERCPGVDRQRVVEPLAAVGLVVREVGPATAPPASDSRELALELSCRVLGKVAFTYLHAATVTARVTGPAGVMARHADTAFADDGDGAVAAAMHGALSDIAARLATRRNESLVVIVEEPWPAQNVRRFQTALAEAVLGVRQVTLDGLEQTGAVRLRVDGDLDARALVRQLRELQFPGFELADFTLESSHAVHVRLE